MVEKLIMKIFGTKENKNSFDKFFDVSSLTEDQISKLSINEEIDIAVDLMAHCNNGMENRFGAFVIGCAPIQINFLEGIQEQVEQNQLII